MENLFGDEAETLPVSPDPLVDKNDQRYEVLFDSIDQGFCVCEMIFDHLGQPLDYRFLEINNKYEAMTGLKEVIGKTAREVIPDLEEFWFETYGRVVLTGKSERFENEVATMNRWFDVNAFVLDATQKNHFGILFTDISDRKYAERRLRESEKIYRAIGETLDYGIWINDPNGQNLYASPSFLQLLGITQEECAGLDWGKYLHPDQGDRTIQAWLECVRTESPWDWEHQYRGVDGNWHPILARGVPVRNNTGEIIYWAGINLDISGLKEVEQLLRQSEERLRFTLESNRMGIWDLDLSTGKIFWSDQMFQLFGYSPPFNSEVTEEMWNNCLHPDDIDRVNHNWQKSLQEYTQIRSEHRLIRFTDQQTIWVEAIGTFIYDDNKQPIRSIGIIFDISDRKRTEQQYAKLLQEVQEQNQELDNFSHIVSHDLKAPLRAIANLAQWLEEDLEGKIPPDNQLQLQLMRSRAYRMEALINGLLNYARISKEDIPSELVSIQELLSEIIDSLDPLPPFKIEIAEPLPTFVTKRILLNQVLTNLIGNAIKHHDRPDGTVKIGVQEHDEYYEFTINDDGRGIEPKQQERIFDIFQTLGQDDKIQGTGIGLAIVKKIVNAEGGKVYVKSEVGKGSTFHFTWHKSKIP